MAVFRKKPRAPRSAAVQTAAPANPFSELDRYVPLARGDGRIYAALREGVPLIDSAIFKIIRLTGGFKVKCRKPSEQAALDRFFSEVNVSGCQTGIDSFVSTYFEQLLTYGNAVGEIILRGGNIAALYNAPLDCLEVKRGDSPENTVICRRERGEAVPVKYPELVLYSVLNPEPGAVTGNSLLKGLPFVSSVLLKIYNTIGLNFERVGNLRFAVTYNPGSDPMEKAYAGERAAQIAKEWSSAMQSREKVRDFIAAGDVSIRVIGADNQILDSEVPVRQMLEQIVAKTGLPPFMFGLSWSSTERMSAQQADVLTSELEAYRRILSPVILKIANTFLRLSGMNPAEEIIWDDITLQDQVEMSKARLYTANAEKIEESTLIGGEKDE